MTEASRSNSRSGGTVTAESDSHQEKLAGIREHLLADPWDEDALSRAGAILYEMGRFTEAVAHLGKAISSRRCPPDRRCEILMQLADCYTAMSDCEEARRCYRVAAALAPANAGPFLGLGTLALRDGRTDEAQRFFQTAREVQPDCSEAYGGLAMVHQQRLEHAAAFEMYLKCLELDTDNLVALLGLFQTSCRMGTFSKIIHYLEIYLDKYPADTSVLFCLASLYAREGRLSDARRVTMKVLTLEPDKQEAAELLAELKDAQAEAGKASGAGT